MPHCLIATLCIFSYSFLLSWIIEMEKIQLRPWQAGFASETQGIQQDSGSKGWFYFLWGRQVPVEDISIVVLKEGALSNFEDPLLSERTKKDWKPTKSMSVSSKLIRRKAGETCSPVSTLKTYQLMPYLNENVEETMQVPIHPLKQKGSTAVPFSYWHDCPCQICP